MGVVKGAINITSNAVAVLQGIKKEQASFRQDVEKTRSELARKWDKKWKAKVDSSAAAKQMDTLKQKLQPLKKKVNTVVALKDMATAKVKSVTDKVKAAGKMVAKPIVAIKDATAAGLSKIAGGLKSLAKGIAIPVSIAGAAVIGGAIAQGAKLEQSIGGVETLFKDDASVVKANADKAFKTAGLSANEYMETVTGFSASLLGSLGGDTAKSAQVADMAITDMADNANKFGTDMESIQNAYQGFAKQNYTMLDNLKLGYGGTKEEMSRLLSDASKLTGVKYNINNLSDVYSAIHSIQENLGVTGTTAKEASETFSGSFAAMKSAASNLLGNLAIGGDVTGPMEQLVDSASTFLFSNAIPMISRVVKALPGAIKSGIKTAIPRIKEAGGSIISSLKDGMVSLLPSSMGGLLSSLIDNAGSFVTAFGPMLPVLASFGGSVMGTVSQIATSAMPVVGSIINTVQSVIPSVLPVLETVLTTIGDLISAAAPIISGMVEGIGTAVSVLAPIFDTIFSGIGEKVGSVISFVSERMGFISEVINTAAPLIGDILTTAWSVISPIMDLCVNVFKMLFSVVQKVFPGVQRILQSVWNVIKPIVEGVGSVIGGIASGFGWIADKISGGGDPVGQNARGTNSWRGGLTWVGEEGPELMDVPRGSRILPTMESIRFAQDNPVAQSGAGENVGMESLAPVLRVIKGAVQRPVGPSNEQAPLLKVLQGGLQSTGEGIRSAIGQNAKGTNSWQGGPTWVGERGPELLEVPRSARILPTKESMGFAMGQQAAAPRQPDGSSGLQQHVEVTIAKLADQIIVREEADIEKIGTVVAQKIVEVTKNTTPVVKPA